MASDHSYLNKPIARLFPDKTPEELAQINEAAESMESLRSSPGFLVVLKVVDAERRQILETLSGREQEHIKYVREHGRLDAMSMPQQIIEAFLEHAEACNRAAEAAEVKAAPRVA